MCYRSAPVDVGLFLDTLRRQFESPREQQGRHQTNGKNDEYQFRCPRRQLENGYYNVENLKQYPGCDDIGNADAYDVAATELSKEFQDAASAATCS
jgi:hypothetical protein